MRDPYIESEYERYEGGWLAYPYCHYIHADCLMPELPGCPKKCYKCEIAPKRCVLPQRPVRQDAGINNWIRHIVYGMTIETKVFETWYKHEDSFDDWSMERPDVKVCDCKDVVYYLINDVRYDDFESAFDVMMDEFCKDIALRVIVEVAECQSE